MFAVGYTKTGLGKRMALWLIKRLGKKTLGLGYAIALSDLVLAPFTPSNTARSGGTIYPIISNMPGLYGSQPGETSRKIGSYIMYTALATTCVTSSMFLTSLAPNVLAVANNQHHSEGIDSMDDLVPGILACGHNPLPFGSSSSLQDLST